MSERFYVSFPLTVGPVVLQGPEAHHLTTVRRFRPGDAVCLFNGDGSEYRAEITMVDRRQVELNVLQALAVNRELPFRLVVACPLPKGDRGQFLIEKLTELGVTTYVPLRTQRSIVHPGEGRADKLERYVIEASKQCGRNILMKVEGMQDLQTFICRKDLPDQKLLAHQEAQGGISGIYATASAIAVGPEGGFTPEELSAFQHSGWQPISLANRVLRIETAAIALSVLISLREMNQPSREAR